MFPASSFSVRIPFPNQIYGVSFLAFDMKICLHVGLIRFLFDEQADALQQDLLRLRKENEALRFLLQAMTTKCNTLEQLIREKNIQRHDQFPVAQKTTQFLVRTDSKDNTLVSLNANQLVSLYGQNTVY